MAILLLLASILDISIHVFRASIASKLLAPES